MSFAGCILRKAQRANNDVVRRLAPAYFDTVPSVAAGDGRNCAVKLLDILPEK
jgi:hypothetical protein